MSTIEMKNVTKRYGSFTAVDNISITFQENCIYGLLGRNGAGKSTILKLITGRLFPSEGEILIDGEPVYENDNALSKIYMMSEDHLFLQEQKIKSIYRTSADFYPDYDMEYAIKLSEQFGLNVKKSFKSLSTGYKTISKIINALACNAPIIFLDEPVLGLDANHRDMFYRELVTRYSERPATYVISTHIIEETANFLERAVIIKNGKLIMDEETDALRSMGYSVSGKASDVDGYTAGKNVMDTEILGGLKTAYITGSAENVPSSLEAAPMSLQKLFIHLTNT